MISYHPHEKSRSFALPQMHYSMGQRYLRAHDSYICLFLQTILHHPNPFRRSAAVSKNQRVFRLHGHDKIGHDKIITVAWWPVWILGKHYQHTILSSTRCIVHEHRLTRFFDRMLSSSSFNNPTVPRNCHSQVLQGAFGRSAISQGALHPHTFHAGPGFRQPHIWSCQVQPRRNAPSRWVVPCA